MFFFKRYKIRSYEMGLLFRDGEFQGLLTTGTHWFFDPLRKVRVDVVSQRDPWLVHEQLDMIIKSGALKGYAIVLDLKDTERALVWIENRFSHVLPAGQFAYWTCQKQVSVEIIDIRPVRFEHAEFKVIVRSTLANRVLDVCRVSATTWACCSSTAATRHAEPGEYAFWKGPADAKVVEVDLRETMVDVGGQEIMTADKVTLRLNAVATYKIVDARKAISQTDDVRQALYRDTQLVLRAAVGARSSTSS